MKPFFSLQNVRSPKQIKHLEGLGNTLQGNFHSKSNNVSLTPVASIPKFGWGAMYDLNRISIKKTQTRPLVKEDYQKSKAPLLKKENSLEHAQ